MTNGVPEITDELGNPLILCDFLNDNLDIRCPPSLRAGGPAMMAQFRRYYRGASARQ